MAQVTYRGVKYDTDTQKGTREASTQKLDLNLSRNQGSRSQLT